MYDENKNFAFVTIMIPGPKCGLIIGKNGETIKQLKEATGCRMKLIQEDQFASMAPKPLKISGTPEQIEAAKQMIEEILMYEDNRSAGKTVCHVIVPRSAVGLIVGKNGETIRRLSHESGARIQFKHEEGPYNEERTAEVHGTPEQIVRATQLISEIVMKVNGDKETYYLHVPTNKTGLVIGRGGEIIKAIQTESGARVELSKAPPPNYLEKVFSIEGTPYQVHHAVHLIRMRVGDIPMGTPVPSYDSQVAITMNGSQFDPSQTQQWQPVVSHQALAALTQDTSWNPAYSVNQQSVASAPVGMVQPHQPPKQSYAQAASSSITPTNDSQAGQSDYSQQWIDYYRSLGMHEQVAQVEHQIRMQKATAIAAKALVQKTEEKPMEYREIDYQYEI